MAVENKLNEEGKEQKDAAYSKYVISATRDDLHNNECYQVNKGDEAYQDCLLVL